MNRRTFALAIALCVSALGGAAPPSAADPLPDLVIASESADLGTACDYSSPVVVITVVVANSGDGPSMARSDNGAVVAVDKNHSWTAGAPLPDIAPGASVTVTISFFADDPRALVGPHTFRVTVNRDKKIPESNYTNNSSVPMSLSIPASLCKAPG